MANYSSLSKGNTGLSWEIQALVKVDEFLPVPASTLLCFPHPLLVHWHDWGSTVSHSPKAGVSNSSSHVGLWAGLWAGSSCVRASGQGQVNRTPYASCAPCHRQCSQCQVQLTHCWQHKPHSGVSEWYTSWMGAARSMVCGTLPDNLMRWLWHADADQLQSQRARLVWPGRHVQLVTWLDPLCCELHSWCQIQPTCQSSSACHVQNVELFGDLQARSCSSIGRIWPVGHMFDIPALRLWDPAMMFYHLFSTYSRELCIRHWKLCARTWQMHGLYHEKSYQWLRAVLRPGEDFLEKT